LDNTNNATDLQYSVMELAPKAGSDQVGLMAATTNNVVTAWIWSGTAFGSFAEVTATGFASYGRDKMAIAWETNSGHLLAATAAGPLGETIVYREFTTSWSSSSTYPCGTSGKNDEWLSLKPNPVPTTDEMILLIGQSGAPSFVSTCYWSGSGWSNFVTHDAAIDSWTTRSEDFAWESTGSRGLLVWGTNVGQITYRTFTAPNTWGTITNVTMGTTSHYWVTLRTNPLPQPGRPKILGAVLDFNDDLGAITWDGSAFTVVGANSFTADTGSHTYENFDLEYRPAVGGGGSVYYKNKAAGTWRATVSWGTTYTGLSVDVSPQTNFVSLARYYDAGTNEIQYTVCKTLASNQCDAASEFKKADNSTGYDTVATGVESGSYPSLATTWDGSGDLWVAYAKDVNGTTRAIYARFLDYPSGAWAAAETVDSLAGTIFTHPSIGIDKNNNVHALYASTSGPQLYYKMRSSGTWDPLRTPVDASSDSPSLMVRAPNDASYGVDAGGLYWKGSTSQTYFYHIPEFEEVILPIAGSILVALFLRRRTRSARRDAAAS